MMHLVTGGSGSGKSEYAELQICRQKGKRFYIATMEPFGEETQKKIQRHRRMRAGKGFETIECYVNLKGCARELPKGSTVLLECMSNLVANELYREDGAKDDTVSNIMEGIQELRDKCNCVVIVTNEVCSEIDEDTPEMETYKQVLSQVNIQLAKMADTVTEVVYGIPVKIKR